MQRHLDPNDTYGEALHALRRLRDKRLIAGNSFGDGTVCATQALRTHLAFRKAIDELPQDFASVPMMVAVPDYRAADPIMWENDSYNRYDNTRQMQRKRYKHMVAFLESRVRAFSQ